jgi:siroheme synthase
LLTGHRASGNEEADWQKFVSSGATLAIYMPGHHYSEIAARLRRAGAAAETRARSSRVPPSSGVTLPFRPHSVQKA